MIGVTVEYEADEEVNSLTTEQWYYSLVDGDLFMVISIDPEEVVIADMTGATEIWERKGTVFNSECEMTVNGSDIEVEMSMSNTIHVFKFTWFYLDDDLDEDEVEMGQVWPEEMIQGGESYRWITPEDVPDQVIDMGEAWTGDEVVNG